MRFSFVFMVLGIVLSVGILSAGLNLFAGYERTLKAVLLDSFAHISISETDSYLSRHKADQLIPKLEAMPEVQSVSPTETFSAMVNKDGEVHGALIRGYDFKRPFPYRKYIRKGEPSLDSGSVYIGHYMASELGLEVGDSLKVVYPQLNRVSALGIFPGEYFFRVAGIYRSGYYEYDRSAVIMTLEDAINVIMVPGYISNIELKLKPESVGAAGKLAKELEATYPELVAQAWTQNNDSLFRLIAMEKWLIFIIFSFLVLIAGLNVVSAVVTIMYDKKNEIAVLKTLGAGLNSIRGLIFYRIALVGIAAIILGQIFGWILSLLIINQSWYSLKGDVYFIDQLTIYVSPFNQVAIFVVSACLILICVRLPLRRINRMEIIELIRNPQR
ncbi:MAG TPA: ABC transporter permease, partial [Candidatus Cloacimonadota bacterium]|nr:ABC transporter permease [Candidatus Cloacimonadota bacterium]